MSEEVLRFFERRRSIRAFTGEPVAEKHLRIALRAAMSAPSAHNGRPWQFIVLTDRERIREVCSYHPYAKFGVEAGAVVLPCSTLKEKASNPYYDQDMAAATENLLLAVANLGLGATWCGVSDEIQPGLRRLLGASDDRHVFALVPIGVPAETKGPPTGVDEARIFWNEAPG